MDYEKEIYELQIKLSYLEDFLNQIQEVTVNQSDDIEKLKKENKLLKEKINDLIEFSSEEIPNRKPPHY